MDRRRGRGRVWIWLLVTVIVLGSGYVAQREVMRRAFDRLEADQVSQDARLVRLGLDGEIRLLISFGATNSYWDDSYQNVRDGDRTGFAASFPPADLHSVYGVDGVIGTARDGTPRVGGLATGGGSFSALPPELRPAATLRTFFDPDAEAGTSRCGAVTTSTVPFLYCGFGSFSTGGAGPAGGLIFLKALDPATLSAIGTDIGLPITVGRAGDQATRWPSLTGRAGELQVRTTTLDDTRIELAVQVPATGGAFTLTAIRDRPIHGTALSVGRQLFLVLILLGGLVLLGLALALRQGIRRQVAPLRRTTEAVIASGDRTLRVGRGDADGSSEIAALGRAIDSMLDALAEQEERIAREQAERERQLTQTYEAQRQLEQQTRERAQQLIAQTVEAVGTELAQVSREVEQVRTGAATIDQRVEATGQVTRDVAGQVGQVDAVASALGESLRRVGGIATLIRAVTEQTKLLALNATIEAERAGAAGRGFRVVASEVKELASSTARSTDEITRTVEVLTQEAEELTRAIGGVVGHMENISVVSGDLHQVTEEQRSTLHRLDERVAQAVARIRDLRTD